MSMRIEIQLRIVGDDDSVISVDKVLHLDKSDDRLEAVGLSLNIVTVWVPGRSCRTARSRWSDCSSWLATRYRSLRPMAMDLPTMTSKLRFLSYQFRTYPPSMPTMTVPCGSGWSLPASRPPCCSPPRSAS